MTATPLFRNDDVSFDTDMTRFPQFCDIFHRHGYRQLHAVTLRGLCNYANRYRGCYCVYPDRPTLSLLSNEDIRTLSAPYRLEQNQALVRYLAETPDDIALHGLYHTNYGAMDFDEQLAEMREGLLLLQKLFPRKDIRFFVPPFNKINAETRRAANMLGLRVLGDEGIHLEEQLAWLTLEPGIWYRYHHHRFYPESEFDTCDLSLDGLDAALSSGVRIAPDTPLAMPSFDYEGDIRLLKHLVQEHKAQSWFISTAENRLERHELQLAMGWIYAHLEHDAPIFEVGCGSGNNLVWLTTRGYRALGGSDVDDKALQVASGMAASLDADWQLLNASLFRPEHIPSGQALIFAVNCVIYHQDFVLADFLQACARRLRPDGCVLLDQVDASFNGHPCNAWYSPQWHLPEQERTKPSEYRSPRIDRREVEKSAAAAGMEVVASMPSLRGGVPRCVYVFARKGANVRARRPLPRLALPEPCVQPTVEALFNSGLFDWVWYRKTYVRGPEIMEPLEHYVRFGAARGYRPNAWFDSAAYRRAHLGLADPTNPLLHALMTGRLPEHAAPRTAH